MKWLGLCLLCVPDTFLGISSPGLQFWEAPEVGWMKGYRLLLDPLWSEERNGGVSSLWGEVAWRVDIDLGSRSHQKMESVDYVTTPPGERGSGFWTECFLTVTSSSQFSQNLSVKYLLCVRPLGAGREKLLGLLVIMKWSKAWETDKTDLADSEYLMSELGLYLAWAMHPPWSRCLGPCAHIPGPWSARAMCISGCAFVRLPV